MTAHLLPSLLIERSNLITACGFSLLGMMIESMAGKSAGLNGVVFDATPFTFDEDDPAIDYFGNLLKQCLYCFVFIFSSFFFKSAGRF